MLSFYRGKHFLNFIHKKIKAQLFIVFSCRNNRKYSFLLVSRAALYKENDQDCFCLTLTKRCGGNMLILFFSKNNVQVVVDFSRS